MPVFRISSEPRHYIYIYDFLDLCQAHYIIKFYLLIYLKLYSKILVDNFKF